MSRKHRELALDLVLVVFWLAGVAWVSAYGTGLTLPTIDPLHIF